MASLTWIKETLQREGIPFREEHHREAFTAQALAECEHLSGHRVAKVVVVLADGFPVELVLPATRRVVLERVRQILGVKQVRLASEEEMAGIFSGCETGAMPALRHWPGVDLLMDTAMEVDGDIVFPGGTHSDTIRLRFDDWFRTIRPRVESFSVPEHRRHMIEPME